MLLQLHLQLRKHKEHSLNFLLLRIYGFYSTLFIDFSDLDAFPGLRAGLAEHEAVLFGELPGLLVRHVALSLEITLVTDQEYHLKLQLTKTS